jgi:hypothetical protein
VESALPLHPPRLRLTTGKNLSLLSYFFEMISIHVLRNIFKIGFRSHPLLPDCCLFNIIIVDLEILTVLKNSAKVLAAFAQEYTNSNKR